MKLKERIRDNVIRDQKAELRENGADYRRGKCLGHQAQEVRRKQSSSNRELGIMEDIFDGAYARYFSVGFEKEEIKREMCSYEMEKDISEQRGGQPRAITSKGSAVILVEVASEGQSKQMRGVTTVLSKKCVVSEYAMCNGRKRLIYIDNHDLANIDSFKEGLAEVYPIIDVPRVTWIKPTKPTRQSILIQFAGEEVPEYLRIIGKYTSAKVYPYSEKPLICRNCQKYGHGKKRCTEQQPTCSWCAGPHEVQDYNKEGAHPKCANCAQPHGVMSSDCGLRKRECDILETQRKQKVDRWQERLWMTRRA